MITFGRPSAGRQVTRAALPVLPRVLAHDARDEDHSGDQGEAPHRMCVETGHQHTAPWYLSLSICADSDLEG